MLSGGLPACALHAMQVGNAKARMPLLHVVGGEEDRWVCGAVAIWEWVEEAHGTEAPDLSR